MSRDIAAHSAARETQGERLFQSMRAHVYAAHTTQVAEAEESPVELRAGALQALGTLAAASPAAAFLVITQIGSQLAAHACGVRGCLQEPLRIAALAALGNVAGARQPPAESQRGMLPDEGVQAMRTLWFAAATQAASGVCTPAEVLMRVFRQVRSRSVLVFLLQAPRTVRRTQV
jgi:hypothetical protein